MDTILPIEQIPDAARSLVRRVASGETVVVTEAGAPLVELRPAAAERRVVSREEVDAIQAEVRRIRAGLSLRGLSIKDLINEGRR
ncbi:type II toxin-antitoxin system prevent-host-death family antitoxin [Aerophototrophica crusticola]|uniref:Type II toxin-antitoxin system prevent-host-death family antitoxin n=1 Tax=Aerophototrophica crusticola TaxID=1709002 RepID=A0A858R9F6_9PROT|nr:type II toxin-antitoxin system prevent-host-death family antitoxin [Rhodospirillaceae bacterium B3]